jgi:hypothetical protein
MMIPNPRLCLFISSAERELATQWLFNFVIARAVPTMLVTVGHAGYGTYFVGRLALVQKYSVIDYMVFAYRYLAVFVSQCQSSTCPQNTGTY